MLNHVVFDIEANNWIDFEMAAIYDGESEPVVVHSASDLLDVLLQRRFSNRPIFAHNGGKYDFLFLLPEIQARNLTARLITQGPRVTAITIKDEKQKRKWVLQDSFALLPKGLAKLAKDFGTTQKLEGAIDFKGGERVDKRNPLHVEYCRRDSIALWEVIASFRGMPYVRDVKPRITLASTAMAAWRTTLRNPIRDSPKSVKAFVRSAYAGGRCEIFNQEAGIGSCFDVNSLFPSVMRNRPIPTEYQGPARNPDEFGFHEVTVQVPRDSYIPPLFVRGERLLFPTGTWRGTYFSEEIKEAEKYGAKILKFHKGHRFSARKDLFTDYVDHLYRLRTENPGTAIDAVAKLLLNSSYGKFAERAEKSCMLRIDPLDAGTFPKIPFEFFRGEDFFQKTGLIVTREKRDVITAQIQIGAAITAWARIAMLPLMQAQGEKLRYTDTDSLFTSDKIPTGENLGELKREYDYTDGFFLLPKAYFLKKTDDTWVKKVKGFPTDFLNKISLSQLKDKNLNYRENKILTMKSALIQNKTFLARRDISKSLISAYTKRRVLAGGQTAPLHYENGVIR